MKTKPTPGPWGRKDIGSFCPSIWSEAKSPKGQRALQVLIANTTGPDAATAEANARLIAAAPDMLEQLKALVGAGEFCVQAMHDAADPKSNRAIVWKDIALHMYAAFHILPDARAVIANAEGTP